jgi:hypothetical protein
VTVGIDESAEAAIARRPLRHPVYRESSVSLIAAIGPRVADCDKDRHCLIMFDGEPTVSEFEDLRRAFGDPKPNPHAPVG